MRFTPKTAALLGLGLLTLAACRPAAAQKVDSLTFLGQATFPTGTMFQSTVVGGLSGIVFDASRNVYYSLSDDRSEFNPARFYTLTIDLGGGALSNGKVAFTGVTTLRNAGGNPFPALSLDPEGIALTPDGKLYIASEGDKNSGIDPFVNRFTLAGQQEAALTVPGKYRVGAASGIRNNLAFESLTLTPDGTLVTATENALLQDGPAAGVGVQSPARILTYDLATGTPGGEYLYLTDAVAAPPVPAGGFATNGLVDLLALGGDHFLALERSFSVGVGNSILLYQFSLAGATDIRGVESLTTFGLNNVKGVEKTLVFDLGALGIPLDNIEGLTFGPTLAGGDRSLILVSDNNFSGAQFTQFVAFSAKVSAIPEPGTFALAATGLLPLVGVVVRRRKAAAQSSVG